METEQNTPPETNLIVKKTDVVPSAGDNRPEMLQLSREAIGITAQNIAMAEELVTSVLEKDIDYGLHPGTRNNALREPGTSKILNAFNVYPRHTIIQSQENEEIVSYLIHVELISRKNGQLVGTGVGGCSTLETKYGFRWVDNPTEWGVQPEQVAELRTRQVGEYKKTQYRILNPDVQDLGNTILKMAAKRAEMDAAQTLPGVGSALRKLFDPDLSNGMGPSLPKGDDFKRFWGIVKGMGINEDMAHKALDVKSMKDWTGNGHTLDEALITIGKKLTDTLRKANTHPTAAPPPAVKPKATPPPPATNINNTNKKPADITVESVITPANLEYYAKLFWGIEPDAVYIELGYKSKKNFIDAGVQSPWDAFQSMRATRQGQPQDSTPEELDFN